MKTRSFHTNKKADKTIQTAFPEIEKHAIERAKTSAEKLFLKNKALTIEYFNRLNDLLKGFRDNISIKAQDNQELFDMQNSAWKAMCHKAHRIHKGLNLPLDAFEKTVTRNHYINKINSLEPSLSGKYLNSLDDKELLLLVENEDARKEKASAIINPLKIVK